MSSRVDGKIYRITNTLNGKVYIGQTTRKLGFRWSLHKSDARLRAKTHWQKAIRLYGGEAFSVMQIDSASTMAALNRAEVAWIALYRACESDYGYNGTSGGWSAIPVQETRQRMSKAARSKPPVSQATRVLLSVASKGRPKSGQHAAKIASALKGRTPNVQCREAVAEANRQRVHSPETRAKLRLASLKGNRKRWHRQP